MVNRSRALVAEEDRYPLIRERMGDTAEIVERNNPGKGMMWACLISVVLWLVMGAIWAAIV